MSSIMRARNGLTGRWEGSEVIRDSFLEPKVAGPSMLGIGRPDRHALPHITRSKHTDPDSCSLPRERVRSTTHCCRSVQNSRYQYRNRAVERFGFFDADF